MDLTGLKIDAEYRSRLLRAPATMVECFDVIAKEAACAGSGGGPQETTESIPHRSAPVTPVVCDQQSTKRSPKCPH